MLNTTDPLPSRVAQSASAAFGAHRHDPSDGRQAEFRGLARTAANPAPPVARPRWTPRAERVELPPTVTDFWPLKENVVRFESALCALADASGAAATAGFDAESRATLHRAWADLRDASTSGTFVPRARVSAIGVSMACESALQTLLTWREADAAKVAFELTGATLGKVLHQGRSVLVESASQTPTVTALMMRFVKHLHPLPTERPTAQTLGELEAALADLAELHPAAASREAFARCLADVTG